MTESGQNLSTLQWGKSSDFQSLNWGCPGLDDRVVNWTDAEPSCSNCFENLSGLTDK
jgi:hypothetical protein